jgi:hypothetical protein
MGKNITTNNTNSQNIDVIAYKINDIQEDVKDIKAKLEANYVTKEQFDPVKKIVYGMVSVILLAVIGAVVALVLR